MLLQKLHLLVILCYSCTAVAQPQAPDCVAVGQDDPCPQGMVEYYSQFEWHLYAMQKTCCGPDTAGAYQATWFPYECQASLCRQTSTFPKDTCSTSAHDGFIKSTVVNGTELRFEHVTQESCTLSWDASIPAMNVVCCPSGKSDSWLLTALDAEPHQFPHNVFLLAGHEMCGGTIYNERYVITASHCLVNRTSEPDENGNLAVFPLSTVRVYVGSGLLGSGDLYMAEEINVNPESTLLIPNDTDSVNDIALIRVSQDIQFGPNVMALPIAEPGFEPLDYADHAVIVGFGDTDTLDSSVKLERGNTILRSNERNLGPGGPQEYFGMGYADKFLFVGGVQDGQASVTSGKGDSGGPAVCRDASGYATLCGLDSIGGSVEKCEEYKDEKHCQPKIYVRVSTFNDWIIETAGDQSNAVVMREPLYGKKVVQGKYEHQVRITSDEGHSCGGTLISKNVVLTAAHCVVRDDQHKKNNLRVVTGVRDLENSLGGMETFGVGEIALMEGFGRLGEQTNRPRRVAVYAVKPCSQDSFFVNDLAVFKLQGETSIRNFPGLATHDPRDDDDIDDQVVWSTEVALPLKSNKQKHLAERQVHILSGDACQTRIGRMMAAGITVQVNDHVMCGEEKYTGGSLCDRELGGGLMCTGKYGEEVLCGVQTFRMCDFAVPTAYINVASSLQFIRNAMSRLQ